MDVKGEVLLQLFNKSKLRNGTKTYVIKFKKLGFNARLSRSQQTIRLWSNRNKKKKLKPVSLCAGTFNQIQQGILPSHKNLYFYKTSFYNATDLSHATVLN